MRILVLGATGRTGSELVAAALAAGHDVSALVRDPERLGEDAERLRTVTGDAQDAQAMERACEGQETVLCALGPRSPRDLWRCELMQRSIGALVAASRRHGVKRVILLSALGAGESAKHAALPSRIAFRTMLRRVGEDKDRSEDALRASDLDWTVVYPPSLTNAPPSGAYRHGEDLRLAATARISRADVAHFMLVQAEDSRYSRRGVIIGP